jgi:hypothetical protein
MFPAASLVTVELSSHGHVTIIIYSRIVGPAASEPTKPPVQPSHEC